MLAVGQTLIKALAARLTQLLEATAERGWISSSDNNTSFGHLPKTQKIVGPILTLQACRQPTPEKEARALRSFVSLCHVLGPHYWRPCVHAIPFVCIQVTYDTMSNYQHFHLRRGLGKRDIICPDYQTSTWQTSPLSSASFQLCRGRFQPLGAAPALQHLQGQSG